MSIFRVDIHETSMNMIARGMHNKITMFRVWFVYNQQNGKLYRPLNSRNR